MYLCYEFDLGIISYYLEKFKFEEEFVGKVICGEFLESDNGKDIRFLPLEEFYQGMQETIDEETKALNKIKEAETELKSK